MASINPLKAHSGSFLCLERQEGDGDRKGIHIVGSHDIYLVDTEAQTDMEGSIHQEECQGEPEEL